MTNNLSSSEVRRKKYSLLHA